MLLGMVRRSLRYDTTIAATYVYIRFMISVSKHHFSRLEVLYRLQHQPREANAETGQQPTNQLLHEREQVVDNRLQAQQQR